MNLTMDIPAALQKENYYDGQWIVPGDDHLRALFEGRNLMTLDGSFTDGWYWSGRKSDSYTVLGKAFEDGEEKWYKESNYILFCRPVRFEPSPSF
jgi:hypothetical protein